MERKSQMDNGKNEEYGFLVELAYEAMKSAYAPYSKFSVGAALLTEDGKVFGGCNIENASYPTGICAERTAFVKAISEGNRKFSAIAICASSTDDYIVPCGICRQFMSEFCPPDFPLILAKTPSDFRVTTLGELLPYSFSLK